MGYARKNKWIMMTLIMMAITLLLFFFLIEEMSSARGMNLFFLLLAQVTFGVGIFIHTLIKDDELTLRAINIGFYLFATTILSAILITKNVRVGLSLLLQLPLIILFWGVNLYISNSRELKKKEEDQEKVSRDRKIMMRLQLLEEKEEDREAKAEIRRLIQIIFLQGVKEPEKLEEMVRSLELVMQGDFYSPKNRDEKMDAIHQYLMKTALPDESEEL